MFITRRPVLAIIVFIVLIIGGFLFLLRGCLAKYDERSAIAPALYFEKDGRAVLFSIVKFDKATSYSQKGGITTKSVSTRYFIQTNDVATGQRQADKQVKKHSEVKTYPVEVVGAANGLAWVFIGELMAFDPFTLEQKADLKLLQEKNPSLKDKLPVERRFYVFNKNEGTITITAADGSLWKLNTASLAMAPVNENEEEGGENGEISRLEKLVKQNQADQDSLYEQKMRRPSRMLAAKEITMQQYRAMMEGFNDERTKLYAVRDSLRRLLSALEKEEDSRDDIADKIESLQSRTSIHFSQVKVNMDTVDGKWRGLYTKQEAEKLMNRFQNQSAYGETARRQLFFSSYGTDRNGDIAFDKEKMSITGNSFFLDGGFLLNKNTARPVRLSSHASLVVHKDIIGNEGKIQVSLVNADGKTAWTYSTGLKEWADWIVTDKYLVVFGTDNRELSSSEVNIIRSIDLATGSAASYDFFTDKR